MGTKRGKRHAKRALPLRDTRTGRDPNRDPAEREGRKEERSECRLQGDEEEEKQGLVVL